MKKISINNLTLKIIASILMTLSHIGLMLAFKSGNNLTSSILTTIGGLAFPLFLFLLIEGINNTSSLNKYLFRLGISALFIYLLSLFINLFFNNYDLYLYGNIFIDLFLYVLLYKIFNNKNAIKYVFIGLIIIFFIITHLIKIDVISLDEQIYKIIGNLFPQYSLFGLTMFLVTLISFKSYDKKVNNIDETFKNSDKYTLSKNIIYCIILALFSFLSYIFTYIGNYLGVDNVISTYFILDSLFIIFYSYKKINYKGWIKYLFYIYYPLHLLIIFMVIYFI